MNDSKLVGYLHDRDQPGSTSTSRRGRWEGANLFCAKHVKDEKVRGCVERHSSLGRGGWLRFLDMLLNTKSSKLDQNVADGLRQ